VREGDPAAEKSWNGYAKIFILAREEEERLELTCVKKNKMVKTMLSTWCLKTVSQRTSTKAVV